MGLLPRRRTKITRRSILQVTSKLEDRCDKRTIKSLPKMGKKAPLCYEHIGQLVGYAELVGTCGYGCPGKSGEAHAVWYLVARASSFARAALRLARMGFYDEALIVIRSLGEIANLLCLFVVEPTSIEEWKKSDLAYRLKRLSPSKIRRRIEARGKRPPITAEKYAALCEVSTHAVPDLRPQKFNHMRRSATGGIFFQKAGLLVVLNELAETLSFLVVLAVRVCNVPAERQKEITAACAECLELSRRD
jgi:hypothetical protein